MRRDFFHFTGNHFYFLFSFQFPSVELEATTKNIDLIYRRLNDNSIT